MHQGSQAGAAYHKPELAALQLYKITSGVNTGRGRGSATAGNDFSLKIPLTE